MLAQLRFELETEERLGYCQSSVFQGVLMDSICPDYATKLHESTLHSYSQYLYFDEKLYWVVSTTDKEAYQSIIEPLLRPEFNGFHLDKKDADVKIVNKSLKNVNKKDLLADFNKNVYEKYLTVEFITPTSFKSNDTYALFPDVRMFFASLMKKYSASSSEIEMCDDETLDYIEEHCSIVRYNLRSAYFPLEGSRIPAFRGQITLRFNGTSTMASYAKMLIEFGEYSGVGIKTGIGMGAIKLTVKGDNQHD